MTALVRIANVEKLDVGEWISVTVNGVTYEMIVVCGYTDTTQTDPATAWTVVAYTKPGGVGVTLRNDTLSAHSAQLIAPF